jgi:hypothetical protein
VSEPNLRHLMRVRRDPRRGWQVAGIIAVGMLGLAVLSLLIYGLTLPGW